MIQRIQSVFLLIAAILCGITVFAPLAWFGAEGEMAVLHAFVLEQGASSEAMPVWTGILLVITTLLPAVTIFLFKHRMLQVRLCITEAILCIGALVMMAYTYFSMGSEAASQGVKPAIALPAVALVFVLLAAKAIFRDEMLVRSLDRIR